MNICSSRAVCWICPKEGADEKGKPLICYFACRSNDAGFAHVSCIIKYVEKKSEESLVTFHISWSKCPTCNQGYQNDIANQLVAAFVLYANKINGHPGNQFNDKLKVMLTLQTQIELNGSCVDQNEEAARQMSKNQLGMNDGWACMAPDSLQVCSKFETIAYYCL
jgi:hypothetical protein